jgi:predicted enzyme involved in methoxymalonyl-ACP biosynthesis
METNLNLSLINGVYSSEEAKEILMNVFASKIQFHELKNLRSIVTIDTEDEISTLRVRQLKQAVDQFNELLKQAEENNLELAIQSSIQISLRKSEKIEVA